MPRVGFRVCGIELRVPESQKHLLVPLFRLFRNDFLVYVLRTINFWASGRFYGKIFVDELPASLHDILSSFRWFYVEDQETFDNMFYRALGS